jgi:hypothetical protein
VRTAARKAATSRRRLRPPRLLTYVDAVARHGSIRKAADALNVASSALNRQILDLEADLGSALFERLPRGVRLTAAGEVFLAYSRQAISELKAVESQVEQLRGLVRGQVSVAAVESVAGELLPSAITQFQAAHPNDSPGTRRPICKDGIWSPSLRASPTAANGSAFAVGPSSALDAGGPSAAGCASVMPDDRLSDVNDVLLQGAGWHVQSDYQPWPGFPAAQIPEWQHSTFGHGDGRDLGGKEAANAIYLSDQFCDAGLVFHLSSPNSGTSCA